MRGDKFFNHSPWIEQLKQRPADILQQDTSADVVIIGGGIAGVATAYFALKETQHSVLIIEAGKVAHGATGHNAGQIVSYFERPFSSIVKEFGLKQAAQSQKEIISAWKLISQIYKDACLHTPLSKFTGYAGCSNLKQLIGHLENKRLRKKAGLDMERVYVSEAAAKNIPKKYTSLYSIVQQWKIQAMLETNQSGFIAVLSSKKGCLNSAAFTEEMAGYLLRKYKKRFRIAEHTPVKKIVLEKNSAVIQTTKHFVSAKKVVLCTNGFENLDILNTAGPEINRGFHEMIHGIIGYMAAYIEHSTKKPTALSYFLNSTMKSSDPYFYLTRRYYEQEPKQKHALVCVGGPEIRLNEKSRYHKLSQYLPSAQKAIDLFIHSSYAQAPKSTKYKFKWHGLMGYTKTRLRCIGPEKRNKVLLYNLGCNGVGILPSIYGGKRIAQFLQNKKLKPLIFDPR